MAILPSGYQEVEYIQSTATNPGSDTSSGQYIDTLVTINKNIKVDIDMQFTSLDVQSRLFGGLYDSGSSGITFGPYINGSTQWARATANGLGNWQSTSVAANTNRNRFVLDNTRYIIYNSSGTQVYNGTNSSTISNSDTWTIPLFASKDRSLNKVNRHSSAKLYGCKIWDNDVLVRDFVPCYRKSDNEIGLYDLVNNQFYSNSGTGSFIKGADILPNWKIQRIYLGTNLIRPPEITETYTRTPFQSSVSIYKSGYKIKQAIMEWEGKYTGSNWYITEPKINSSGVIFSCVMSVGGSYGYNYGDGQGRYGGIRMQVSGAYTGIVSVNSGATTKSQNAGRVIITPESIEYHIGKTFNSWLQEGTATPSSTISGDITTLFNSNDVNINGACWNSSTSTFNFYRCIVTYEPI